MGKSITGSVGLRANCASVDVMTVQYLLNCVPSGQGGPVAELVIDGIVGPKTLQAIKRFQVWLLGRSDGRVDVGGKTLAALQKFDPFPQHSFSPYGLSGMKQSAAGNAGGKAGGSGASGGAKGGAADAWKQGSSSAAGNAAGKAGGSGASGGAKGGAADAWKQESSSAAGNAAGKAGGAAAGNAGSAGGGAKSGEQPGYSVKQADAAGGKGGAATEGGSASAGGAAAKQGTPVLERAAAVKYPLRQR